MSWESVKPWVAKIAPMLGTALGGPLGGAAGSLLGTALGIKDASPESVEAAIAAGTLTGDQIVALKQAEQDFALQCRSMDINSVKELEDLAFKDRDSARNRQIQVGDKTPQILAYLALAVWSLMNGMLLWMAYNGKSLPVDMSPIIMRVLGTMDALLGMAFAFFLGTTRGSQQKNEMLYKSIPADSQGGQK